jgi:5-dehydro-2-deoxygluconokinase
MPTTTVTRPLDLLTVGRISVDLYAAEAKASYLDPQTFVKSIGGSPTNVAIAASRLGHHAAVLTKVGADPFGDYVVAKLEGFGVDTSYVGRHPTLRTPLAFAAMTPPEDPVLMFYREPEAPDMTIELADAPLDAVREAAIFWVSASCLSRQPIAGSTRRMLDERGRRTFTVLDLDYRSMFWPSRDAARVAIGAAVPFATVAVGNREECDVAVGSTDPAEAARRLLDRGVELAIVKMGGDGVLVATKDGSAVVAPTPVKVVCGLGAGDAFGGALVHGLLNGWPPEQLVRYANAAGAIVAARLLCSDDMPTAEELEQFLATGIVPVRHDTAGRPAGS